MMYELTMPATVTIYGIAALAFTYVVSKDPGRRQRARELLKLLIGR
jgi:hypothetical protein